MGARGRGGVVLLGRPRPGPHHLALGPDRPDQRRARPVRGRGRGRATACGRCSARCRCSTRAADEALVETVAAEAGRVAALLAGDLPHTLVEHAEEAGVELLPYGGELGSTCTCEAWADPCPHALAVMYQLAWLVEADPFVLLHLRGLARDELLARLHERAGPPRPTPDDDPDLDVAVDAALTRPLRAAEAELADGRVSRRSSGRSGR